MKKHIGLVFTILLIAAIFVTGSAITASAQTTDSAGNTFEYDRPVTPLNVEGDYFFLGYLQQTDKSFHFTGSIENDFIFFDSYGMTIDAQIGGSIRGYSSGRVEVNTPARSATLAGTEVIFAKGTVFDSVYLYADTAVFSGEAKTLSIIGTTVYIYGNVTGDLSVTADNVYISSDVDTELIRVTSANAPIVIDGNEYIDYAQSVLASNISFTEVSSNAFVDFVAALPSALTLTLLIALLLMRKLSSPSFEPIKLGKLIGYGIAAVVVMPFASIFILLTGYGTRIGLVLLGVFAILLAVSQSFASVLIGKKLMPNLHVMLSSIIVITVLRIVTIIPYVGSGLNIVLYVICMIISCGYILSSFFSGKPELPPLETETFDL